MLIGISLPSWPHHDICFCEEVVTEGKVCPVAAWADLKRIVLLPSEVSGMASVSSGEDYPSILLTNLKLK